ncbi:MAG: threonine synthase [Acetobacterales bacterium]
MRYISTRGKAPVLGFEDVLLTGLARDGGLYVPESWPAMAADDLRALHGLPYPEAAVQIMRPYLDGAISDEDFGAMVADSYAVFGHPAVVPLRQLESGLWLLELFHGPTLAFKDVALQLVGRLFDHVLKRRGERITVVGATSGDTGSAAIEACRHCDMVEIFILHPKGRVSEVQRRQMTTVDSPNVHNIAVEGNFDDCQDLVKAMFNDAAFRDELNLSAVNSINWARIMPQIVYYVTSAVALGAPDREVTFVVPSGNFGNVFAAYAARQMGLPVQRLVVASNSNDILTRFFDTGTMRIDGVEPTWSPSMDIQVSSNFERYLFDLCDRNPATLAEEMRTFRDTGSLSVGDNRIAAARQLFDAGRVDDDATLAEIRRVHADSGEVVDPHTAVGIAVARVQPRTAPVVCLATAHPAKFGDAVAQAIGECPALPSRLSDLMELPERAVALPNDLAAVEAHIRESLSESVR